MKTLSVYNDGLLGTEEDIKKLSELEEATILVLSDSHRNIENFKRIIQEFGSSCDVMIFCGDGAYDLSPVLDTEFFAQEKLLPSVIGFVRGNGDPSHISCYFEPYTINIPDTIILEAAGKKIFFSHGHNQGIDFGYRQIIDEAKKNDCQIILHGHTHVAKHLYYADENIHLICPGSISLPRYGTEKSFCILTIKNNYIDAVFKEINPTGFITYNPIGS